MKWMQRLAGVVGVLMAAGSLSAQGGTGQVVGTVTSAATGRPLAGAQVVVVGTQQGAMAGADGRYTISGVAPGARQVRATFLGHTESTRGVTVTAGGTATANLALETEAVELEGLVAIGYGTQRKQDVTGAVTSVKAAELVQQPVARVDQALAGKAAGVQVQTTSNHPGATMRIRIRGGNSLRGNNDPLTVIDGVLGADLNQVNPSDIESIEVLKDASATAIYGARGANGVILVTTKRGRIGESRIDYNGYYGMQTISGKMPMLTASQHAAMLNANPNSDIRFDDPNSFGAGTDWQEVIFQDAPMQNHQLTLSGGSGGTRYLLSGAYLDQSGVIKRSDYMRGNLRLNLDQEFSEKFRAGSRVSYARSLANGARINDSYGSWGGPVTITALTFSPIVPVYDSEGNYSGPLIQGAAQDNPLAIINEQDDISTRNYLLANVFGEYDLLEGLTFRTSLGYELSELLDEQYTSRMLLAAQNEGLAEVDNRRDTDWLAENTLTLQRSFGDVHDLTVLAGFTAQEGRDVRNRAEARGFPSDLLKFNNLGLASLKELSSSNVRTSLLSYLGRINYSLAGKYLFTVSGRADGSSKFARNNKWAFFPSAAVAWRVSEESFMAGIPAISDMKLRASYGKTGSEAIGPYQSLSTFRSGDGYDWNGVRYTNGVRPNTIENPNLKWETTAQYDIGADISLFDNLFTLTADYYQKKTSDLLYAKQLPNHTGYTTQIQNIGSMENKGVELALDTHHFLGGLEWQLGGNISFNRNTVLDLGGDTEFTANGPNGSLPTYRPAALVRVGEPVGNFYGYVWDGIFQTEAEAAASGQSGAIAGGMRIKDLNEDGRINDLDRTILGNAQPDYTFGITGSAAYSGLDLSFVLRGVQGNDVANVVRVHLETPGSSNNQLAKTTGYWTGEGSTSSMTKIGTGPYNAMSDRWIEDGSFVRLQNLTLGYTIPEGIRSRMNVGQMRLYLSAQNLFTWTDYSWYDPEINSRGNSDVELGWDDGGYPGTKTLTLGVNVGL